MLKIRKASPFLKQGFRDEAIGAGGLLLGALATVVAAGMLLI
jgi:hypothetical protein